MKLTPVVEAVLSDPGTPASGPGNADVTIVEFGDYQCAPCKVAESGFEAAVTKDGRVRVLYKDWPILGPRSRAAAQVALAAAYQGRYVAVHEAFMRTGLRLDPANLRALAISAGADWPRLQADLAAHRASLDALLRKQAFEAWSLGLHGPPAYLIGPYLREGRLNTRELDDLIRAARRHGF